MFEKGGRYYVNGQSGKKEVRKALWQEAVMDMVKAVFTLP